jgi:Protein of unknown function (DUF2851)
MTEDFLQFIWKYGLFERSSMIADTGEIVQVTGLGEHNTDSGPDFLNARIKIGDTTWAGNVEIHLQSADWINHKHQSDKAYDNVILHVVYHYNQPVIRDSGEVVPTVELKFDNSLYGNYSRMVSQKKGLPCANKLETIDPLIIDVWLNSLVIERLQQKTQHISGLLALYKNNWEEVFYVILARTFGFGLNAVPFEMTARSISLSILARHRGKAKQTEAILMGQAGFLDEAVMFHPYYGELRNEYIHLKNMYKLKTLDMHLWKFLRLRPVNFPTIRLAQFAALVENSEGLFSKVLACRNIRDITALFEVSASEFWNTHYTFDTPSPCTIKRVGNEAVHTIIINAVIPLLFIYGKMTANEDLKNRALDWLNCLPAERNRIVNRWEDIGIKPVSAFYSQGILQLNNMYCNRKHCLSCSIGTQVITATS